MDKLARAVIVNPMNGPRAHVIITGGGLNGPALALALAHAGLRVTVIDAMTPDLLRAESFDGRAYALALASQRLLAAIGLWPQIREQAQPILDIKVSDGHAGRGASPFHMHFDHAELEEGPMGFMVEDRYLRRALLDAMDSQTHRLTMLSGRRVIAQEVSAGGVLVRLDDGTTLDGDLLVGADGRKSGTALRAGIRRTGHDYGQTALVSAIRHEKPHAGTAHQFFMPAGPLAILPLQPGNRSSIVWAESHARAHEINALDDAGYLEALRPRFGDFLGRIELEGKRFTYPLNLTMAESMIAARVALIGDAAHGVHPIAGQGLNAGLRDVAALAETLVLAARRGEDIGAAQVLERYAQWRRFDSNALALATDMFNKLFSNDNPVLRTVRHLGLGLVNATPGLRRGFIREAAGLTGDLPRLMRGQPL
ncbi:FAD-dependent monooxygenase [Pontibaca methylaminivorans]|uniref:2-octaprenyl-6-methoxyphenol hydroxylase /2-octaprenyl-3-methyl-6-methoxy-1,4-benzoquinol hydroxylase n=1 Tax=Pontibaca methylaminivorans TaxID=515897 RepID=A0A1R3WX43_9RHOB|nr:FAD-dependent monooxygenase [Pontibaca methylaminivorans]SIT82256.1 2-octaprenyl-6-methoxyphenol hydroxylase /2-octaprenyl-3-methyl-6-methoxy-1,4-benzoquinol hydroxylase [Pontibaca methylaminivorans]